MLLSSCCSRFLRDQALWRQVRMSQQSLALCFVLDSASLLSFCISLFCRLLGSFERVNIVGSGLRMWLTCYLQSLNTESIAVLEKLVKRPGIHCEIILYDSNYNLKLTAGVSRLNIKLWYWFKDSRYNLCSVWGCKCIPPWCRLCEVNLIIPKFSIVSHFKKEH